MMHGLMWFPLLIVFTALAWAGWNEYQKVETYRVWATGADRAKYDIRAALVQRDEILIWGQPSRSGILAQQTVALAVIEAINVQVDGVIVSLDNPPLKGASIILELVSTDQVSKLIPFTEIDLAIQWAVALKKDTDVS